ncbi:phosphoenolpyruvate--protein phosphotransferase [Kribbella deserti]|uniref:Phosphoenolpyruvate-protein phosphotransferase n=1 Tax=Kribbella deserti TaxID=1926257 RepID=A0ABV6QR85_9ACTN
MVDISHGLHARPAAKLVGLVRSFDVQVSVTNLTTGKGPVDAGSLSRVATLNARQGHHLRFDANGPQAADVLDAISQLAARHFDEGAAPTGTAPAETTPSRTANGSGLDLAIGPALLAAAEVDLAGYEPGEADDERERSQRARGKAAEDLRDLRKRTAELVGPAEASIFDAHLALLDDEAVLAEVAQAITAGASAPEAWRATYDELAKVFAELEDAYQRERAQDVRSVRDRILSNLANPGVTTAEPDPGGDTDAHILVVPELDAGTAASIDAQRVAGIAVRAAGMTGHGVIVARSRGIPLIAGIGVIGITPGALVAFDAREGTFLVEPDASTREAFTATIKARVAERETALAEADRPAVSRDGQTVHVMANVGSVEDARTAFGADGSGLIRTEVLFGDRREAPGVDEQVAAYGEIAKALGGRPITIRTWDVGGDKPLAFLPLPAEANPFLGERGLRVFRDRPELFRDQLRAVREIAGETPTRVMFPMVTTLDEVRWAVAELDALGPRPDGLGVGIMVEVPAAALRIASLAAGLDFVSIGTNDLTQYTTAADRGNGAVAQLADGLDPAVLRLIDHVVRNVPAGVAVAVCGDLASDPAAAVLLAALGVRELSAIGPQIPAVKARLRQSDLTTINTAEVLSQPSSAAVRAFSAGW